MGIQDKIKIMSLAVGAIEVSVVDIDGKQEDVVALYKRMVEAIEAKTTQ